MNHFLKRLESKLLEILESNPSKDAPYHNNPHMTTMWAISRLLWETEKEDTGLGDPDWDYVVLMFASLLHDYAHSGGRLADSHNVETARKFIADLINRHGFTLPNHVVSAIDQAVACTEYPFVHEPTTKLQMVIRDADVLYPAFVGDPRIVMEGLRLEASWRFGNLSYQTMYLGQVEFASTAKLFTQTARDLWDVKTPVYLERLKQYAEERGMKHV